MTFNAKSETYSEPPQGLAGDALLDAWREALGETLAIERRQWERERALIEAQAQRTISDLRASIATLRGEVLDLVRARLAEVKNGEPGAPGAKGERGERGLQGEQGKSGPAGPAGEVGPIGPMGAAGEVGPAGLAGPAGEPGAAGPIGPAGPIGITGERGADGGTGPRGDPGLTGQKGDPGERGETGTIGLPGVRGERGERGWTGLIGKSGPAGPIGPRGERGLPGVTGAQGLAGERGERGESGIIGKAGPTGERGVPGAKGERGEQGERGAPGLLPIAKLYEPGAVHYAAQVVAHSGGLWQATKDTGQAPPHADWMCLARAGLDGVSPRVRGTHREGESYRALDIVAFNKGSFIAVCDDPGPLRDGATNKNWQLLTAHGGKGEKGVQGPRGEAGPAGPGIARWLIDRRSFVAKPVLSDGSEGASLDLRELFEQFQSDAG
jgi:hypothetical protein